MVRKINPLISKTPLGTDVTVVELVARKLLGFNVRGAVELTCHSIGFGAPLVWILATNAL